jgi:hypothetical protein
MSGSGKTDLPHGIPESLFLALNRHAQHAPRVSAFGRLQAHSRPHTLVMHSAGHGRYRHQNSRQRVRLSGTIFPRGAPFIPRVPEIRHRSGAFGIFVRHAHSLQGRMSALRPTADLM